MKSITFKRFKSRAEAISKSVTKSRKVGTLFCIVDEEVFVFQRLKLIELSLEQFANGMNISLAEAQIIVSGEVETVEDAKMILNRWRRDDEEKPEVLSEEDIAEITSSIVEDEVEEIKEVEITEEVVEKAELISPETELIKTLIERIEVLEAKVNAIMDEVVFPTPEEAEITEELEDIEEELLEDTVEEE